MFDENSTDEEELVYTSATVSGKSSMPNIRASHFIEVYHEEVENVEPADVSIDTNDDDLQANKKRKRRSVK